MLKLSLGTSRLKSRKAGRASSHRMRIRNRRRSLINRTSLSVLLASCLASGASAAEKIHIFTEATAGNESRAQTDEEAIVECPAGTTRSALASGRVDVAATLVLELNGQPANIQMIRVPGRKELCPFQIAPDQRALSLSEYRAATEPEIDRAAISTVEELLQTLDSRTQLVGSDESKAGCSVVQPANIGRLAPGYCSESNATIASVYFLGTHLAMTTGGVLGTNFCVFRDSGGSRTYYDVHDVRRIGSGSSGVAGLSLMRAAPATGQVATYTGPLIDRIQVDGAYGQTSSACQRGFATSDDGISARFLADGVPPPFFPIPISPGGPARAGANLQSPIGVHSLNQFWPGNPFNLLYVQIRRYLTGDIPTLNDWLATAAPPADKNIVIDFPGSNQIIDSSLPLTISVDSAAAYTLKLDGQIVGNTINNIANGPHTLVAYNNASPKYRHTIHFEAQTLSNPADSYEPDNQRDSFTALFEGSPQQHTFHSQFDVDWMAYAVGPLTRSTVTLSGNVAQNAQIRLYRQLNYPTGSIDLVGTRQNTPGQLVLSNDNPGSELVVYYVEARPTSLDGSGPGSQYSIAVQTVPLADSFEFDGQIEHYNALFEGVPQTHTFHSASDEDWVAYAVSEGTNSRVDLTGIPAEFAQMEMYRQFNYPDGAIELIGSNALMPGTLRLEDTAPDGQGLVVYYVVARPFNLNPGAVRSSYTLSVTTQ